MNNIYLYDGSFFTLLALISYLITSKHVPSNIKKNNEYVSNLLDIPIDLVLDNKNEKVMYLKKILSVKILNTAYYVFLSNDQNKELIIYYFLKNALIFKDKIFFQRNLNCVNRALKISQNVSREAHHIKGFLRFKETKGNYYYAEMAPTNNIIGILANHFQKRLANEYWIIKDTNRKIYAIHTKKKVIFLNNENIKKLNVDLANNEENIEDLWKAFFNTIAIKERKNLRVQMNFMPKKYWKYIIEMEDKK